MYKKLFFMVFLVSSCLWAGEEVAEKKWTDKAELSGVWTSGNSESNSYGLGNNFVYKMEKGTFTWDVASVRVETSSSAFLATGTAEEPIFEEIKTKTVSAESLSSKLQLNRQISNKIFWFTGLDWERNEPRGFSSMTTARLGISTNWITTDTKAFKTSYGMAHTIEDQLVPVDDDSYTSAELGYNLMYKFGNSQFDQILGSDFNLEESDDWRFVWENKLSVSINSRLALKVSCKLNYDNQPLFSLIKLTGGPDAGQGVLLEKDELDTTFNASLVINF